MIAVLQAAKAGKTIELRQRDSSYPWVELYLRPLWAFDKNDYRVKPEPREWWLQPASTCDGYYVLTDPAKPKSWYNKDGQPYIKVREIL